MPKRICVFCGSNSGARPIYAEAARALARHLVANGIGIVYGGSKLGLMGALADEGLAAGGEVIGVIPQALVDREIAHPGLSDLRVVGSMHERKALMVDLADAFIAMPGGYGTLDEFCEVLTWAQLGIHRNPCGLLNIEGYFDPLLRLFDHALAEQFLKPAHHAIVIADDNAERLVTRLLASELSGPSTNKWIGLKER